MLIDISNFGGCVFYKYIQEDEGSISSDISLDYKNNGSTENWDKIFESIIDVEGNVVDVDPSNSINLEEDKINNTDLEEDKINNTNFEDKDCYYMSSKLNLKKVYGNVVKFIQEGYITEEKIGDKNLDLRGIYNHNNKVILPLCVFDTEVSKTEVIFGFFFPYTKSYHSISLNLLLSKEEFNKRRLEIIDFFMAAFSIHDVYYDFTSLRESSNLSLEELAEIARACSNFEDFGGGGVVPSFLNLNNEHPVINKYIDKLDKLIAPLFITYNGEVFDNRILNVLFYYHNNNYQVKNNNLYKIERDIMSEDPEACINAIFGVCENVINNHYKENLLYTDQLPFSIVKNYFHFDLYNFLKQKESKTSLTQHKNQVFLKKIYSENNFPKFIPLELINSSDDVDYTTFKNQNYVMLYNFNDTFYTYQLFLMHNCFDIIQSRLMYFQIYKFNPNDNKAMHFALSLNKKDSSLGVEYIIKSFNPYTKITDSSKTNLTFEDLILLNEYKLAKSHFEKCFMGFDYLNKQQLKDQIIKIKNSEVKIGVGGIHSGFLSEESDNLQFEDLEDKDTIYMKTSNDLSKSTIAVSDENNIIIDLDVKSFYVELIIQIFKKSKDSSKAEFFDKLKNIRNKLKKEKNPLQLIYKIIILSITGQFNAPFSPVFDPLLYFSMTTNGQLIILEFLLNLEECNLLTRIISVNTDGVTIVIPKNKLINFKIFVKDFERKHNVEFDTFDIIKSIISFNVNKYIIIYEDVNKEPKVKGFPKGNFEFVIDVLLNCAKNLTNNTKIDLNFLFENFEKTYTDLLKEPGFSYKLLGYKSYNKVKKVFFFSQRPDSFSGIEVGGIRAYNSMNKVMPIEEFTFLKILKKTNFNFKEDDLQFMFDNLKENLSKAAYFKYMFDYLVDTKLLSYDDSQKLAVTTSSVDYRTFFDTKINELNPINKEKYKKMLYKTYPIFKSIKYLQKQNIFVIPKSANKKTLPNFKENQSKIDDFLNPIFLNAAAISINLEKSFPNIVVFDVDEPDIFFNPAKLKINIEILKFLRYLVKNQCIIVSSPTKQQIERFKVVFKLTDTNSMEYKEFKNLFNDLFKKNNLPFKLEERASIVGTNIIPWELLPFYNLIYLNKDIPEISLEKLQSMFESNLNNKKYESVDLINITTQLLTLRNMSPNKFRKEYNVFETKNKNQNYIRISNNHDENYLRNLLIKLEYVQNKMHDSFLKDIVNVYFKTSKFMCIKTNVQYDDMYNFIFTLKTKQPYYKTKTKTKEGVLASVTTEDITLFKTNVEKLNKLSSTTEILSSESALTPKNLNILKITIPLCYIINNILEHLALTYKLNFRLKSIQFVQEGKTMEISFLDKNLSKLSVDLLSNNKIDSISKIQFTSNCIFKPEEYNNRLVMLTFTNNNVNMICFHDNCKIGKKYAIIENEIKNQYIVRYLLAYKGPFKDFEGNLMEFLAPSFDQLEKSNLESVDKQPKNSENSEDSLG